MPAGLGAGVYVSHPVAGKHLAFDGRLLHGALHELAAPGMAAEVDGGGSEAAEEGVAEATTRVTLLVNLWAGRTPAQLSRVPERVAAPLQPHPYTLYPNQVAARPSNPIPTPNPNQIAARPLQPHPIPIPNPNPNPDQVAARLSNLRATHLDMAEPAPPTVATRRYNRRVAEGERRKP